MYGARYRFLISSADGICYDDVCAQSDADEDKPHPDYDMADWVLSAFKGQDAADMELVAKKAADAVECYITEGADRAMNRFN